jgi:hypothetical protein
MGVIYAFLDKDDNIIYIGSTIRHKEKRYEEHTKATSFLNTYITSHGGFKNFRFQVLDIKDCNKDELQLLERSYIEKYKPICNMRVPKSVQEERDVYQINYKIRYNSKQEEEECLKAIKI